MPTINPGSSNRVKYRSSCDRCQDTKVKCGQEKPECDRCVKKRLVCVYSPIRTMGRPRKSQTGSGTSATVTAHPPPIPPASTVASAGQKELRPRLHESVGTTTIITHPQEDYPLDDMMQGIEIENNHHTISPLFRTEGHGSPDLEIDNIDPELDHIVNPDPANLDTHTDTPPGSLNSSTSTGTGTNTQTTSDTSSTTGTHVTAPSPTPPGPSSCYTSILSTSLKLEQILLNAAGNPIGLEAVLEAESDFRTLKAQLFTCTGNHTPNQPPKQITAVTGTKFILTRQTPSHSPPFKTQPCLSHKNINESKLALTTLLLLAERVAEVLKDAIADFQPFPGVDSCSTRCSYFGVQKYRVLRAMDFHALRVDGFFLERGSEGVNLRWDLGSARESLALALASGGGQLQRDGDGAEMDVEVVDVPERQPQSETEHQGIDGEVVREGGSGYENRHFGSMTPAEGRVLRRIFRLRMRKFRDALVDIRRFVTAGTRDGKGTGIQAHEKEGNDNHDHDRQMVAMVLGFIEPMVDNLVRRVEVMEQVMAGTLR